MTIQISFDEYYSSFDVSSDTPFLLADNIKTAVRKELKNFYENNNENHLK